MYLKQVVATGFKSFADKTNLHFSNDITGIVGPNGSGKSNVVDAVRWVLGEQSVKSLRGEGSMTDVIFSGSKTRNAASYASVELIFDNKDHYFQINYNELSVKRMVYKTGENEYYINNQKCRLKDIINLVIDNGIGRDAFNIISQGNIQDILSGKSEDRRIIFDEAAGVSKYKKRKIEALKKLEKTNNNIARVQDILLELEQQLGPLHEQSIKAMKYVDSKKELEQVEIALIKTDIHTLNKDYQETKQKIDEINNEITSFLSNNSSISSKLEEEKITYHKQMEEIRLKQNHLIEITANVERLAGEKKVIHEREKYKSDDAKVQNNLILLKETILKLKNDIHFIELEIENEKQQKDLQLNQTTIFNQKIATYQKEKEEKTKEIRFINERLMTLRHQIRLIEISIEEHSLIPGPVKMVLSNPKLRIHNILGHLLEVKEPYVKAIEIALGYNSNLIVVDDEDCAKDAIAYLKNNKLGRATFLPLSVIKERYVDQALITKLKSHPSFIDVASNLISYHQKYAKVMLHHLGTTAICKDIDSANQIARMIDYKVKLVTLDGDLINVGGSMTGGQNKATTTTIGEKNKLDQLMREEQEYELKQSKLNDQVRTLLNEIEEQEEKVKKILFETLKIEERILYKERMIQEKEKEKREFEQEFRSNQEEDSTKIIDEILKMYYQEINKKNELENQIRLQLLNNEQLNQTIEELEKTFKYTNTDLYQKQNQLRELEVKLNRMDVKIDTLLNTLNEEYHMTFEKADAEYELMMEAEVARERVYKLKESIRQLGNINMDSIEDYQRIKTRHEFLDNQKNDLFKALTTLNDIIKEMDQIMVESFEKTFKQIQESFSIVFKELFGGGETSLKLTNPEQLLETGVDIMALPPGKKLQHISLLSGGEKALTAIALLFAILKVRPVPFCILDEVEAALDENNVLGFAKYITKLKPLTQFIIITHKKKTMEYVNTLYGITMQETGVSRLVSVKLEDVKNYIK